MKIRVKNFAWQTGYGAFSFGLSELPRLIRYVEQQEDHHHKVPFREEILALLQEHGIEPDPRDPEWLD